LIDKDSKAKVVDCASPWIYFFIGCIVGLALGIPVFYRSQIFQAIRGKITVSNQNSDNQTPVVTYMSQIRVIPSSSTLIAMSIYRVDHKIVPLGANEIFFFVIARFLKIKF
jgi:hypothetical protein